MGILEGEERERKEGRGERRERRESMTGDIIQSPGFRLIAKPCPHPPKKIFLIKPAGLVHTEFMNFYLTNTL